MPVLSPKRLSCGRQRRRMGGIGYRFLQPEVHLYRNWSRPLPQRKQASSGTGACLQRNGSMPPAGREQAFSGTKVMGSQNFTIVKRSFHYSKKIL